MKTLDNPVQERSETIKAQMNWLMMGKRKAVYFPHGTKKPSLPQGFHCFESDKGTFYYNPNMTDTIQIYDAVQDEAIGDILGFGIKSKPEEVEDIIGAVVIRSEQGIEKQGVLTDQENLLNVFKAAISMKDPEDSVSFEPMYKAIHERLKEIYG